MNSNQDASASKYFDADRPIKYREQDRLGRRSFAEAIARQVRAVPAEHGFTIAVVGEWGSGKTSILNMVAETLNDDVDAVAVLRFNPWLFSSADDLVARFFRELSAQLGQNRSERLKDVAKALSSLGQSLAPLSPVTGTTGVANLFTKLTDHWTKPPSLLDERDHLRQALAESDLRVVVLVDDIDRLEVGETREIMRLVRLTSDLPNVVFLLAFDRRHVARSLGENEIEGRPYLDKIVQVSYDLPNVCEAILPGMLLPWLDELMQGRDLARLDREVWGRVLYDVIKPLLGNLRDVKRYLYSIPVTLDTIGQEVALADLLGLEALRILRPSLFDELRAHAECLVHSESESRLWMNEEVRNKEIGEELSAMLERAEAERRILNSVFEILFPATQGFLSLSSYGSDWIANWRKERRVACEEVLRIYLQAGLDEGTIPSRELQDLVKALTDEKKLTRLLDALDEQRFEAALERLEDYERDFPVEAVPTAIPVLVNQMWRLSDHSTGMLGLSPRFKVTRVVYRLMKRVKNPEDLMNSLSTMLGKVETLSGRLRLVEMVGHRESVGHKLISEDHAKKLEDQLVSRLKSATGKQLVDEWDLFTLSFRTLDWLEGEDKIRLAARLREHFVEDGFVLTVFRTAVNYAHFNEHTEKRLFWDELVEVFGEGIADAVNRLIRSSLCRNLSEDDQDTIKLAKEYASGWRPKAWHER